MPTPRISAIGQKSAVPLIVTVGIVVVLAVAAFAYLRGSRPATAESTPASTDAKAYVANLALSDVTMKASESLVGQQVVEVEGRIANNGTRTLRGVDVYCLFYGVDGREVYRERVPIVTTGVPLRPHQIRAFRLPFDHLPDGWNQAVPKMVIAQILFAD